MGVCRYEGCEKPVQVKKHRLCHGHVQQFYKGQELSPLNGKWYNHEGQTERLCRNCNEVKSVDEFYINKTTGNPRSYCKPCMIEKQKARNERRAAAQESQKNSVGVAVPTNNYEA